MVPMTPEQLAELLQASLEAGFKHCDSLGQSLSETQRQVLRQVVTSRLQVGLRQPTAPEPISNPLEALTPEQRQSLFDYIAACDATGENWKTQLLNDWLYNRDSGAVQFIRDRFGADWLQQVQAQHLALYIDTPSAQLQVGDRIELANRLWEWVPSEGAELEWYPGTVIRLFEITAAGNPLLSGTIRMDNGWEFDLHGLYDWNRPNWRWPRGSAPSPLA